MDDKKIVRIYANRMQSQTLYDVMEPDGSYYWKKLNLFSTLEAAREWCEEMGFEIESENL